MDTRLRAAERAWLDSPTDLHNQQRYLRELVRSTGECVVQLVDTRYATSPCDGVYCRTYTGGSVITRPIGQPPVLTSGALGRETHSVLTAIDGYFDHIVANAISPDFVEYRQQNNLHQVLEDFVETTHTLEEPENPFHRQWFYGPRTFYSSIGQEPFILRPVFQGDIARILIEDAFVVPVNASNIIERNFREVLSHFSHRGRGKRGTFERIASEVTTGSAGRHRATIRGVLAALLVSRKTSYRYNAIARFTQSGIEFPEH